MMLVDLWVYPPICVLTLCALWAKGDRVSKNLSWVRTRAHVLPGFTKCTDSELSNYKVLVACCISKVAMGSCFSILKLFFQRAERPSGLASSHESVYGLFPCGLFPWRLPTSQLDSCARTSWDGSLRRRGYIVCAEHASLVHEMCQAKHYRRAARRSIDQFTIDRYMARSYCILTLHPRTSPAWVVVVNAAGSALFVPSHMKPSVPRRMILMKSCRDRFGPSAATSRLLPPMRPTAYRPTCAEKKNETRSGRQGFRGGARAKARCLP